MNVFSNRTIFIRVFMKSKQNTIIQCFHGIKNIVKRYIFRFFSQTSSPASSLDVNKSGFFSCPNTCLIITGLTCTELAIKSEVVLYLSLKYSIASKVCTAIGDIFDSSIHTRYVQHRHRRF